MDNMDKEKKGKKELDNKEGVTLTKKEEKKDTRSSLLVIFGVLIIILTVVSGSLFYQNQKVKEELAKHIQPTPASTIIPSPTPEPKGPVGYVGYNLDGKRFLLDLPENCGEEYGEEDISITCTTDDSIITINPQAGGFGMEGYEPAGMDTGEIVVNGYTWDYKIWIDEDGTAFAAYDLTDKETEDYYLIHVEYDPYSVEAKDYFEDVLSTFRFLGGNEKLCLENKGTWVSDYDECEYMPENVCTNAGGTYNECESACRHELETTACTKQCVAVCEF